MNDYTVEVVEGDDYAVIVTTPEPYSVTVGTPYALLTTALDFATRALFVTWVDDGGDVAAGMTVRAAGLLYLRENGATDISDLPGFVPLFCSTPDHFGGKARAHIAAAWAYACAMSATGDSASIAAATALPMVFTDGRYEAGTSDGPLVLETAGAFQRVQWVGNAVTYGVSIRMRNRYVEIFEPRMRGTGYEMDYAIAYQPDEGDGLRGGLIRNPDIRAIQKSDYSGKGIKIYGDATHLTVQAPRFEDCDYSFWWSKRDIGDGPGGVHMTSAHMISARRNHIYGDSISSNRFVNCRIRTAEREGVLIEGESGAVALECYFVDCEITGNHTDLTTRAGYAITSITDNGGFARLAVNLSGSHLLWAGMRNARIQGTGVSGYDDDTSVRIRAITNTYVDTEAPYVSGGTGTLYHCGWDVRLAGATQVAQVNDIFFTGGNINSIGLFYCYNINFTGTRLKVNAWASDCNRLSRIGTGLRGREEDAWEDVPFVGQARGVFEIGTSVITGADRDTEPTGVMRTPRESAGLLHNMPVEYMSVGVNSDDGVSISGPMLFPEAPALQESVLRIGGQTAKPFVIVLAGQSNAVGRGTGQSLTIPANTLMYSDMSGASGGSMIVPAYGTAPLNRDDAGNISAVAADCRGNAGIAMAREIRAMGLIGADRPIYIVPNAIGGLNISAWNDSPYTMRTNLQAALAAAEAYYGAALTIDAFVWVQGEKNGVTGELYSTDATYYDALRVHYDWLQTLPQWHMETSVLICELLAARMFLGADTGEVIDHGHQRNPTLRRFAVTAKDMKVALVPTSDLVPSGTDNDDRAHFSGPSLDTIGYRAAGLHRDLRVGSVQGTPVSADGRPILIYKTLNLLDEPSPVYLGKTDVQTGHLNITMDNATVWLPPMEDDEMAVVRVHVTSTSGGPALIYPPRGGFLLGPVGLEFDDFVSLDAGIWEFMWSAGQWKYWGLQPSIGNYKDYSEGTIAADTTIGLDQRASRGRLLELAGGCRVGLPAPSSGSSIKINMRTRSGSPGGDCIIGRACHSAVIASGGTGHAVGDIITVGLGGATGTTITARVNGVSAGAITSFVTLTRGCITSTAAPTNPVAQASTTGAGTGATFTLTYSANAIIGPNIGDSTFAYTMTLADQFVELYGSGGYWNVRSDNKGTGGAVTQATSKATGVTLSTYRGKITTNNEALAAGAGVEFVVTNTLVGLDDLITVKVQSPISKYKAEVVGNTAGTFTVRLENYTGGSLSEAVLINFAIIKGSAS